MWYEDENGNFLYDDTHWDVLINGDEYAIISDHCPSQALAWDAESEGLFIFDAIAHELLHAWGGHHIDTVNTIAPGKPHETQIQSLMHTALNKGGHYGTEAEGGPYDPDGASCGEPVIPLTDQIFLSHAWPERVTVDGFPEQNNT